jgi:hypothetical protein
MEGMQGRRRLGGQPPLQSRGDRMVRRRLPGSARHPMPNNTLKPFLLINEPPPGETSTKNLGLNNYSPQHPLRVYAQTPRLTNMLCLHFMRKTNDSKIESPHLSLIFNVNTLVNEENYNLSIRLQPSLGTRWSKQITPSGFGTTPR